MKINPLIFKTNKGHIDNISKQIAGFDLLKFLMSLMIVAIHARAFDNPYLNLTMMPWTSVSVPLFFILSSFFFFKKCRTEVDGSFILFKTIKRLCVFYLFWFVVEFPIILGENDYISYGIYGGIYLLKDIIIGSTFHGSWFLSALIWGIIVNYAVSRKGKDTAVFLFSLFLFIVLTETKLLPENIKQIVLNARGETRIWEGLFWCGIGYLFSNLRLLNIVSKINRHYFGGGILMCFIILIHVSQHTILVLLMAFFLFSFFYNLRLKSDSKYITLRNLSILFYVIHFLVCGFFHKLFPNIPWLYSGLIFYAIVLMITFIVSYTILWLERLKCFALLKYSH